MTKPVTFLQQTYDELKQVVWPSKQDVFRLTIIVLTISVFVGLYIGALDFIFVKIQEMLLK
ncbi:MAG: preprotein translocase subunit SecE [Patescibacteria group bacterium]